MLHGVALKDAHVSTHNANQNPRLHLQETSLSQFRLKKELIGEWITYKISTGLKNWH